MTFEEIKEYMCDNGAEEAYIFDNYETAFIGISHDDRAVYSFDKMIEYLVINDDCTELEAIEWIEYNTIRSLPYYGENAPIILYTAKEYGDE